MNNDSALKGLNNAIIGEIGGSSLRITHGASTYKISAAGTESAIVPLTVIIQHRKNELVDICWNSS